jgi:ribonuclease P protein component
MAENSYTFPKSRRLGGKLEFSTVFDEKVRESRGPLTAYARPNDLGHPRLGITISRKVGTAARRNRIKRLLRESFRLLQHDLPRGYDFVIVVRPHEPLLLADYQRLVSALFVNLHRKWQRGST